MRAALWTEFLYDVRLALRQLRLSPSFSAVAILTLSGISDVCVTIGDRRSGANDELLAGRKP